MPGYCRRFLCLLTAVGATCLAGLPRAEAGRVPCSTVVSEADRVVARTRETTPSVREISRVLDADEDWIERCLQTYGRRYHRPIEPDRADAFETTGKDERIHREDRLVRKQEQWETREAEERAPEEELGYVKPGPVRPAEVPIDPPAPLKPYTDVNRGYKDTNDDYKDVNRGYGDVNRGYQDVNRGYQDVNRGYQDTTSGYR